MRAFAFKFFVIIGKIFFLIMVGFTLLGMFGSVKSKSIFDELGVANFEHKNLYTPGHALHGIVQDLELVAPGMTFYFVNVDESRPAFQKVINGELPSDMSVFMSPEFMTPPMESAGAHVSMGLAAKRNICAVYLHMKTLESYANRIKSNKSLVLMSTIMHETIHCGQALLLRNKDYSDQFDKLAKLYAKAYGDSIPSHVIRDTIYIGHAESFVGAYFRANLFASKRSAVMDAVVEFSWAKELELSERRGYGGAFKALASLCAKPGDCSADIPTLDRQLLDDPTYQASLLQDAKIRLDREAKKSAQS